MADITPIDQWQLRRMKILADMIKAMIGEYRKQAPAEAGKNCDRLESQLGEFYEFTVNEDWGGTETESQQIGQWMEKLEDVENDLIRLFFSTFGNNSIELIHDACRREGSKWGKEARKERGKVSHDARKALLVLNDYLINGMPTDDNIEIVSSEAGQVTYINHHCSYRERVGDSQTLAWALCSSRQAWKDGFFEAFGGVAHQNVSARCQGDNTCMRIITLAGE